MNKFNSTQNIIYMNFKKTAYNYYNTFLNLIYPQKCAICGISLLYDANYICNICINKIKLLSEPLCKKCSKELPPFTKHNGICSSCASSSFYFQYCFSAVRYDELTKIIFHEIKFKKRRNLLNIFHYHLHAKLKSTKQMIDNSIVIPVPLDSKRKKEREFNQSNIIAKKVSSYYHIPYEPNLLFRIKENIPQSILSRKERINNIKGAFIVKKKNKIENKNIILVDDVFTTGSTVNECAKALKEAGANKINVFTLARAV